MKVQIGSTWLAEGGRESVSDFRINNEDILDVEAFLRATEISVFNRGNRKTTVKFSVKRTHDSVEAAETFILEHSTDMPGHGLVTFVAVSATGSETSRYLQDASVEVAEASYTGSTTYHTYTIIGGRMLTVRPT